MNNTQTIDKNSRLEQNFVLVPNIPGWKRTLDITLILLALPALIPLFIGIAFLIRAVSSGPVLFRQERIGYLGKKFKCFKFRTMFEGCEVTAHREHCRSLIQSDVPMVKMDAVGDPRIIPFGRMLRASGLDELPQLINVLRGEMSLVGPRPCLPYEFEHYLPHQKARVNALPGLTGLWQVNGKNRTTFNEMIRLDIEYTHHQTLSGDLAIIFKTPSALIRQARDPRKLCQTPLRQAQLASIIAFDHAGRRRQS